MVLAFSFSSELLPTPTLAMMRSLFHIPTGQSGYHRYAWQKISCEHWYFIPRATQSATVGATGGLGTRIQQRLEHAMTLFTATNDNSGKS